MDAQVSEQNNYCDANININIYFDRLAQPASDGHERFKFYCLYAFSLTSFLVLLMIFEKLGYHFTELVIASCVIFLVMAVLNVLFIVLAAFKVFMMSKSADFSSHIWFEGEKER